MLNYQFDLTRLKDKLQMQAVRQRRPLSCILELTYRCNFRCRMCYIRMEDAQAQAFGRMRTVEEWLDMARQLHEAGVLYLTLTGGECTVYPGFVRLYRALSEMGFFVSVMTNAAALTEEVRAVFTEYPPRSVSVTLYGASNETYAAVTGDPRGFDRTLDGIAFLRSLGIPVGLNFTMVKQNVLDYPKVGALCASLGLPYTLITDITPHNRDASFSDALNCRLTPAERACVACYPPAAVAEALEEAKTLEGTFSAALMPQPTEEDPGIQACIGSYSAAAIYWNGEMNTCISLGGSPGYRPFEVGFEAAWRQLQADHAERFRRPPVCVVCPVKEQCVHSCAARNFEATGDPSVPDLYTCEYVWHLVHCREKHGLGTKAVEHSCQSGMDES